MSRSKVFLFSLFVLALLATLSPAWADDSGGGVPAAQAVAAAPAPATACQPALNLASANSCPAPTAALPADLVPEPEFMHNKHLGYCHCGCGAATCRTSADCGGASCDQFISCC
jgi:hypothetical protein